ncbi:MAG: acyltransferase family protein [Candidatus Bathyarchaeota archaeon]|nr:acyltransferase family protein [Candidatus Bathyarchaeota archaeon]
MDKNGNTKSGDFFLNADLIRVVAITFVIFLHAATEPHEVSDIMASEEVTRWWVSNIYSSLARPAVPMFIMLSGALLLQPSKLNEPLRVFFKKRLARIGPPFLFWSLAYFAWRAFVNNEVLTFNSVLHSILTGPYLHFWFLYLITGLYLVTPLLRIIVAYADWKIIRYFLGLWVIGTAILPVLNMTEKFNLLGLVFIMTGGIGYFLVGPYLLRIRPRRWFLFLLFLAGTTWTIIGAYIVTGTIGERFGQIFYEPTSVSVIVASIALFMFLANFPADKSQKCCAPLNRLLTQISQNTLPIYLFHVMVLESLQKGFFGFRISITTMNPILEAPLLTLLTLFICLSVIYAAKKIPAVKKLIG